MVVAGLLGEFSHPLAGHVAIVGAGDVSRTVRVAANRVNATTQMIRDHYDKADKEARRRRQRRRMESDRRDYVERLGLGNPDNEHDDTSNDDPGTEDR